MSGMPPSTEVLLHLQDVHLRQGTVDLGVRLGDDLGPRQGELLRQRLVRLAGMPPQLARLLVQHVEPLFGNLQIGRAHV